MMWQNLTIWQSLTIWRFLILYPPKKYQTRLNSFHFNNMSLVQARLLALTLKANDFLTNWTAQAASATHILARIWYLIKHANKSGSTVSSESAPHLTKRTYIRVRVFEPLPAVVTAAAVRYRTSLGRRRRGRETRDHKAGKAPGKHKSPGQVRQNHGVYNFGTDLWKTSALAVRVL